MTASSIFMPVNRVRLPFALRTGTGGSFPFAFAIMTLCGTVFLIMNFQSNFEAQVERVVERHARSSRFGRNREKGTAEPDLAISPLSGGPSGR